MNGIKYCTVGIMCSVVTIMAQTIISVNPDSAQQGDSLIVLITAQNTNFAQGNGTTDVWFFQDSSTIHATGFFVNNDTLLSADFNIPWRVPTGVWDVSVQDEIDGIMTILNGFTVTPPISDGIINVPDGYSTIQAGIDAATTGDTVLVQPGVYIENINFNGKNIVVGSLFLFTGDTSFISRTVIDGNQNGSVVIFRKGEDSTAVLSGFTISNGAANEGGGIYCSVSSPKVQNVTISGNTSNQSGGGISCWDSSPTLINVTVSKNTAGSEGGGISCMLYSNPILVNVRVSENTSNGGGGGIACWDFSSPSLFNVIVNDNEAKFEGGGIFCMFHSSPSLINVIVSRNIAQSNGGGISFEDSDPTFENVTIKENKASYGGGISFSFGVNPTFDSANRCNIYLNDAGASGNDLYLDNYADDSLPIVVIVDTFTVLNPTSYHAHPVDNFTFDILHGKIEQVEGDLYVSPEGDDANSGQSPSEPLRTIFFALSKIFSDSLHPHAIYLGEGVYSPSKTGEQFPVGMVINYVSLKGDSGSKVTLNAESQSHVILFDQVKGVSIENVIVTGGSAYRGAGIFCNTSSPILKNVTVTQNMATWDGGGIACWDSSGPTLVNTIFWNNSPQEIYFPDCCRPGSITISYSDIQDGEDGIVTNNHATVNWLEGNIDADPLFCDPDTGNYSLAENSPCVGTGENGTNMGALGVGCEAILAIGDSQTGLPESFTLSQNYPNPFNPTTVIPYELQEDSFIELKIYDLFGREVATIASCHQQAGYMQASWDGRNNQGISVTSGLYIYRFYARSVKTNQVFNQTRKMVLLR